ncbi:MAG: hypothetical protein ACXWR1_02780 [Bdellovibrionota bacterium]
MKILLLLSLAILPAAAQASGTFSYLRSCDSHRIQSNPDMQRAFRAIAAKLGQNIALNSCYRSQQTQDVLLRNGHCYPYGKTNCNGTIATHSYHTYGIAGDYHASAADAPLCKAMDEVRTEVLGGRGGVGGYGSGYAHFDNRPYRCSYNICGKILAGGCSGSGPTSAHGPAPEAPAAHEPYHSSKVDQYEKARVGTQGPIYWLHWLLRTLTLGLIK